LLSRVGAGWLKRLGWPALAVSVLLLLLVFTPLGVSVNGNRNWIQLPGGFTAQPSEAAKLGLSLWMACVLVRKGPLLSEWKHSAVPVLFPVGLLVVGLVLLGNDLGTAMIILLIVAGALFFAGTPLRLFI
ncbi:FtsW/RodA/SpoVE family cell cycle protein, partial [Arthrobacter deserti]|nr:FtsW/RodA/SpoVE family cell cycle protein [Arthrobacter deserti]